MGYDVERMPADELYALFGFLLTLINDSDAAVRLAQEAPLGSRRGENHACGDPPKTDGLVEG